MAYPNTSTVYGLAQVIQGEAANPDDQFGVASTIQNRLTNGGWGSSIGSVVTQSQFNGGNTGTVPSATALQYAQGIYDGNLSQYGDTGNVTYYSASNFSTNPGAANYVNPSMQAVAGAGNTLAPGGNSFSTGTRQGPSLAGTILPTPGGSGGGVGTSSVAGVLTMNSDQSDALFASAANQGVGADTPNLQDSDFDGLSDSDIVGTGTALPNDPATSIQSVNSGTLAQSLGGGGTPIDITDFSGPDTAISGAGTAVQKGANTVGSDVQQSAGGITGTIASVFNAGESYFSSAVIIIALVILGLVFVAFGLGMFKHGLVPQVA